MTDIVARALQFASEAHKEHKRLSGEPYITHPQAIADILTDLEQDPMTIAAGLLHDVVEDAGVTIDEIAEKFGAEVARLVEGVTKLGQLTFVSHEVRQAENFRKMFIAMGEDYRIIIIKLADRLHNMRTLQFLPLDRQQAVAQETRDIFAPLAHRLGMWKLKWELEDIAFSYLEPDKYRKIKARVAESRGDREKYIESFIDGTKGLLAKVNIAATIYGRPKHFYSIYHKMADQNLEFEEIYDLTAVRIIVETVKECYASLGLIHASWKPIPGRFRDYIAMSKSNGYQSLHTTVIGPGGRPVEVQIRTRAMHRAAEYGIAAHWRYKEGETDQSLDKKMAWIRQMLEWQGELKDAADFMEHLKTDLFEDEVFVFTPKGDVHGLPSSSTPIDFAYRVHTEIGHRAVGAKVNGRIVPLHYHLKNGDIIEIMTGKKDDPSKDWIRFVRTPGARVKIKNWLKKHGELPKVELPIMQEENKEEKKVVPRPRRRGKAKSPVDVAGLQNVLVRLSKCCKPIPPDNIIGYVSKGRGITVHRSDCSSLAQQVVPSDKLVSVSWNVEEGSSFPVEIEVEAFDRVGVLKDILAQVSELKTNVSGAKITTKVGSSAFLKLTVDVTDTKNLDQVLAAVKKVPDVYEVRR